MKRGFAEDCVCIFGGSGEPGKTLQRTMPSWRAKVQCGGSGWLADGILAQLVSPNRRCATAISTRSVCPDSARPPNLNPIEPPWYGPVCPVVWEGRRREAFPYPDPRRILRGRSRFSRDLRDGSAVSNLLRSEPISSSRRPCRTSRNINTINSTMVSATTPNKPNTSASS